MAKPPSQKAASTPDDFPQVEPQELFPSNNIRFVMWEVAKLTERVDALAKSIDGIGPAFEKALDKHSSDVKERLGEMKTDGKTSSDKVANLKESIDSFKGAMKVLGGIYALVLILAAAFLTWYLRPAPIQLQPATSGIATPDGAPQTSEPVSNST